MANKSTVAWRATVLILITAAVPLGLLWHDNRQKVGTDAMLDVSVSVKTISHVQIDSLGDSVWSPTSGSGFLISSKNCEVITNHHVIAEAAVIEVHPRQQSGAIGIPAKLVNSNPRSDIAILRMTSCKGMAEATLGDSDTLHPGDEVYAVGNPLGRNPDSISRGIVSHTERFTSGLIPFLQTDASISRGSSGGALFNRRGEVVGMNTAILATPDGNNIGVSYALPINLVKKEMQNLHAGPPTWGAAGIEELLAGLTEREASFFSVPAGQAAIIVTESPEDGPSNGKLIVKDVIYEINNLGVRSVSQVQRIISSYNPGDIVTFKLVRAGEHLEVDVALEEGWENTELPGADHYLGYLGVDLEMWREEDRFRRQFESPIITQVHSLGPAHVAHVTSSQKTIARNGPLLIPIQLSVKTITGLVLDGTYHDVKSVELVEQLAAHAFESNTPLLLEVETWGRKSPLQFNEPMRRLQTTFHTIMPALTSAAAPSTPNTEMNLGLHDPAPKEVAYFQSERGR